MKRINKLSNNIKSLKKEVNFYQNVNLLQRNSLHNLEQPSSYLQQSRNSSSLDPLVIERSFFNPIFLDYRQKIYNALLNDPSYENLTDQDMPLGEYKNYINKVLFKIVKALGYTPEDFIKNQWFLLWLTQVVMIVNPSVCAKVGVHFALYTNSLLKLGTSKHKNLVRRAYALEDVGCFMMTEIAHGSNLQGLITTSTYNHDTRSFIIHTPHRYGMKFYIGGLARSAHKGIVFAQMIINKVNYGIHAFLVDLRDFKGNLKNGIQVGDCGPKLGLNGVDNGWIIFNEVSVPYDNLLDKYSQVNHKGEFVSKIKKNSERFALHLSALSSGRLAVAITSTTISMIFSGITTRYLTMRKQFGSKKHQESAVISYPSVQEKLIPNISRAIVLQKFTENLYSQWISKDISQLNDPDIKNLHACCSYIKTATSWDTNNMFLVARELCGAHGFSSYSRIPNYGKSLNAQMTWEGTNDVLIQQTAKFLMAVISKFQNGVVEFDHLKFLLDFGNEEKIQREFSHVMYAIMKFNPENGDPNLFLSCLKRLMQFRLARAFKHCSKTFSSCLKNNNDMFQAFNQSLPHGFLDASKFYGEYMALENFENFLKLKKLENNQNEKNFFLKNLLIFSVDSLRYKPHYLSEITSFKFFNKLNQTLLKIYPTLLNDYNVFFDTILPPDEILKSCLGSKQSNPYDSIVNMIISDPKNFEKGDWISSRN